MATFPAELPSVPVLVGYEPPQKQSRLSVAFRAILVIPHFLFLLVLWFVVEIVVVISWFAALIMGRIPQGMHSFVAQLIRYQTRVYAYLLLLTDRYPPFDLSARDYPVSVEVSQTRLNRAAVLFRIILQIPAYIVLGLVLAGMEIAALFIWLIVLIAGRMPRSLFEAVAATVRYQTRYYAYIALVTPAYPAGLFGDRPDDVSPASPSAFATTAPAPAPYANPPTPSQPVAPTDQSPADLPATPTAPPPPPARPRATRLVLSRGGKRLIALFIVLGVLYTGGVITAAATLGGVTSRYSDVTDAKASLDDAVQRYQSQRSSCQGDPSCLQSSERDLAAAFDDFSDQLSIIDFSTSEQAAASECEADAHEIATFLNNQASGTTAPSPGQAAAFQRLGNNFDQAYRRLLDTL